MPSFFDNSKLNFEDLSVRHDDLVDTWLTSAGVAKRHPRAQVLSLIEDSKSLANAKSNP